MINLHFTNIEEISTAFPTEESCLLHLEKLRWPRMVVSPFDPFSTVYPCSQNRYRCRSTGKYFNVKTGTLFHNSKVELKKWFVAIWIYTHQPKLTSISLGHDLDITQKTAWFMLKKLKNHFAEVRLENLLANSENHKTSKPSLETQQYELVDWLKILKS